MPALTTLRLFAALAIVVHHCNGVFWPAAQLGPLDAGVSFFFVLSGFILTCVYRDVLADADGAARWHFYRARLARIWPLHLACLCLCLLFLPLPKPFSWPVLIANAALLQAWIPWDRYFFSYDYASWSISTELFFYAVFPLLMATGKRVILFVLLLSIMLVALLVELSAVTHLPSWAPSGQQLSSTGLLYGFPLARLSEFVLGVVCGLGFPARENAIRPTAPGLRWTLLECAILAALMLAFAACRFGLAPWLHRAMLAVHFTSVPLVAPAQEATTLAVISPLAGLITREWADHVCLAPFAAGLIVVFSRQRGWITAGLSNRYLVFGGEISFALYLLHQLVLRLMQQHLTHFDDGSGFALYLVVIGIGAAILHLAVEQPARRWLMGRKNPGRF
ncbi:putative transmembrane acyltransferase [Oxalobacteraceae bacterium IMCC9480]|nr:putative transmembrane acyltransferase [Oxalobacteraceae bacterium IMCC9480]